MDVIKRLPLKIRIVRGVSKSLQVHIPAGIDTGKSIRLRGKRNARGERRRERRSVLKVNVGVKSRLRTERRRCLYDSFCSVYDGSVWRRNESADAVRGCFYVRSQRERSRGRRSA